MQEGTIHRKKKKKKCPFVANDFNAKGWKPEYGDLNMVHKEEGKGSKNLVSCIYKTNDLGLPLAQTS